MRLGACWSGNRGKKVTMHPSAMNNGDLFFKRYLTYLPQTPAPVVVEIGSQNVNGSLREVCPKYVRYLGVDFMAGNGVDIILEDPYQLPFDDNSVDIVVSSSCFEHAEMFWLLFLEVIRILKPHGVFYLNAPSNGSFHRYPVDCWRFYPDSGRALVNWANRNGYQTILLESFISQQMNAVWNDCVSVFLKDSNYLSVYPEKIFTGRNDIKNLSVFGQPDILNFSPHTEDLQTIIATKAKLENIKNIISE